jgi:hypothetical protein
MRRMIGLLRANQSQWAIPRRNPSLFRAASTSMIASWSAPSTARRSMGPKGSHGILTSIACIPSSRTAEFLFSRETNNSRSRGAEVRKMRGLLDCAGSGADGFPGGACSSPFSPGLPADGDRNKCETSSRPRASRFSVRRCSSDWGYSIPFFCESTFLKPAVDQRPGCRISFRSAQLRNPDRQRDWIPRRNSSDLFASVRQPHIDNDTGPAPAPAFSAIRRC